MIYLDNAATSFPKPAIVPETVDRTIRTVGGSPGRASHRLSIEASRIVFNAREAAGALIGAPDPSSIAFTKNATEAINIALRSLVRPGTHLIITAFEHNSVEKTAAFLEGMGADVERVMPDAFGDISPADIERRIRGDTALVCVPHASNVFGAIEPVGALGALCRRRNVPLMVDAAQTLGAIPVDVEAMRIDILVATGHKSLLGPQGTGFIYAREGIELKPLVFGGSGTGMDEAVDMPELLEAGTLNTPGIAGLGAAIGFILNEGVEKIRLHEARLLSALLTGLGSIKGLNIIGPKEADKRAGLVAFTIDGKDPQEAGLMLDDEFSIMVRSGTHCAPSAHRCAGTLPLGAVRVSPGYFNTGKDIEDFLTAIKEIAGR